MSREDEIGSFGIAFQQAILKEMPPENERLARLLSALNRLATSIPDDQPQIVTEITAISLLSDSFLRGEIGRQSAAIAARLGVTMVDTSGQRIHGVIEIGRDSGILDKADRAGEADLENIVNVAFLTGYAQREETNLAAFFPSVKMYAEKKRIAHFINPILAKGRAQYDANTYINGYLRGVMNLGFQVGNVVRSNRPVKN